MKTTNNIKKEIDKLINLITERTQFKNYRFKLCLEPYEIQEERYKNCGHITVPYKNRELDFKNRVAYYYEGKITQMDK